MAERSFHPLSRLAFVIAMIVLCVAAAEAAMRYLNWPRPVTSGWRATRADGPVNQLGLRGRPWRHRPVDFVVVLAGGTAVECPRCPPDETLDLILERALRQYNSNAHVVTLGSRGYSQDQEYLALHEYFARAHADLVVTWASLAEDVPSNTFRSGQPTPGETRLKPTFALRDNDSIGPTEGFGQPIYGSKISTVMRPLFIDLDRNWTTLLPKPDPGSSGAPPGVETRSLANEALEAQRTAWSIWLSPRPARVSYGIALTRALLRHMRDLSILHGARFAILLTPAPAETHAVALEHGGHWFLADPARRDEAVAEITAGFETITLPPDGNASHPSEAERRMMARLAEILDQRGLLTPAALARPRH